MKRTLIYACMLIIVIGISSAVFSNARTDDPLGVAVSPQTFLLGSDQGGEVTVHTSISLSIVAIESLDLNGIPVKRVKADSLGNLVAFFDEAAVKAIVSPPEAVMTLSGVMKDGTSFAGSDTVRVVQW